MNDKEILEYFISIKERDITIEKGWVSPKTLDSYRSCLGLFLDYLKNENISIPEINENEIKNYLHKCKKEGIEKSTMKTRLKNIKAFFNEISKSSHEKIIGQLIENVSKNVKISTNKKRQKKSVTKSDLKLLFHHSSTQKSNGDYAMRGYLFLSLLKFYGRRISEALNVTIGDIFFGKDYVKIKFTCKGNKEITRKMPLYDGDSQPIRDVFDFRDNLKSYIQGLDDKCFLFRSFRKDKNGQRKQWDDDSARAYFKKILSQCGLSNKEYTPHSVRHSFVSHKLTAGVPLETVSKLAGHANCQITADIYAHAEDSDLDDGMRII